MKVSWRVAAEQKPSDDREVLASYANGIKILVYYDGEYWCDTTTDNVLGEPVYWMHIPLLPYE